MQIDLLHGPTWLQGVAIGVPAAAGFAAAWWQARNQRAGIVDKAVETMITAMETRLATVQTQLETTELAKYAAQKDSLELTASNVRLRTELAESSATIAKLNEQIKALREQIPQLTEDMRLVAGMYSDMRRLAGVKGPHAPAAGG